MSQQDRSAFMALSSLASAGHVLFIEAGRLGAWRQDTHHGVSYEMAVLTDPIEYRVSRDGQAVSREALLDQTPVEEEELRTVEASLTALHGAAGRELAQLIEWDWEFPDDGRVSFAKVSDVGLEEVRLIAYLDRKDHVAFNLDGEDVEEADALAWMQRLEPGRADQEMALLHDVFRKLQE